MDPAFGGSLPQTPAQTVGKQVVEPPNCFHGNSSTNFHFHGFHVSPVNQNLFRFRNRGDARFRGVEVAASVALPRGPALEIAAQTSRGRDGAAGTPLDDVAPGSVSAIVRHAIGRRVASYLRLAAYRAHDAAGPSEVPTPGYHAMDAGASWRFSPRLAVHVVARNLLDEASYASSGPRWVYAPGRQAVVTTAIGF